MLSRMSRLGGWGRGQRVVLVVALGVALGVLGSYLVTLGSPGPPRGWVAYAPLTQNPVAASSGLHPWVRLLIWLGLTVIWAACSVAILRPSSSAD
jgi:hypothetical protein